MLENLNGLGTDSVVNLGGNALHSCFHCRFPVELEMAFQSRIEWQTTQSV